ncbi:hypothetical protein Tco_1088147, partial [Tanacetum coccineum]
MVSLLNGGLDISCGMLRDVASRRDLKKFLAARYLLAMMTSITEVTLFHGVPRLARQPRHTCGCSRFGSLSMTNLILEITRCGMLRDVASRRDLKKFLTASTQDNIDAGNSEMEVEPAQEYFVLPLWSSYTSTVKSSEAKNRDEKPNGDTGLKTNEEPKDQEDLAFLDELERLKRQEKEANDAGEAFRKEFAQCTEDLLLHAGAARATSANTVNTVSTPISTASPSNVFSAGGPALNNTNQDDSQIPALEDIYNNPSGRIFTNTSYDDEGAIADFTNLESTANVSPIPTSRIHFIHPITQILRDPKLAVQTRSKVHK